MNRRTVIIVTIVAALGGGIGTFAVMWIFGDHRPFDVALMQAASDLNKTLPMMIDKETRLDATIAGPGNRFTYSETLINFTKAEVEVAVLRKSLQAQIVDNYKSHEVMKKFREHDVELHYQYNDKNGVFLTDIVVSPKDF